MRLRSAALILVCGCAGSTSSPAPAPAPALAPASASAARPADRPSRAPTQIAGFSFVSQRNFDDPRLGSAFRYNGPDSLYADVFLYPGPDLERNCDTACASRLMRDEVALFEQALPEMVQRGNMESASVVARDGMVGTTGSPWRFGAHVQVAQKRSGLQERSDFYLYYAPNVRIKVRTTFVETPARLQAVEAFIRDLLPALLLPPR